MLSIRPLVVVGWALAVGRILRRMGRFGSAAVVCATVAAVTALGIASAAAARPPSPYQREADTLARLIRSDARRGGPPGTTLVRTRKGCCGLRIVDVYYRATARAVEVHPSGEASFPQPVTEPAEGAYRLGLVETVRGRPIAIRVSEFGTEPGCMLGTEPITHASSLGYGFQMNWDRALPRNLPEQGKPGWLVSVTYSYLTFGISRLGASISQLRQAITVVHQAALFAPVMGEASEMPP